MKNRAPRWNGGIILLGLLWLAAGCGTPKTAALKGPVFYPPPPDPPRLQFLLSFSGEGDLRGNSDALKTFIVGKAPPKKPIAKPYGLALSQNRLYVCDTVLRSVEIIDLEKRQLRYFAPQGAGRLRTPVNIAVDKDGTRYVADTARRQVLIYGADDTYLGALGEPAPAAPVTPGAMHQSGVSPADATLELWKPTDVAVAEDRLYVTDLKSQTVQVFNKADRKLLFTIPQGEVNDTNRLFQPTNLALDAQGRVYVSDTGGFRVQLYDATGKYLRTIGAQGLVPGTFARNKGVAVDREGRVYVVDASTQVAQIFDANGRLLLCFGQPNESRASLDLPAKVIVDYDHVGLFQQYAAPGFVLEYLVLITNQYGDRKVSIYGFGHQKS